MCVYTYIYVFIHTVSRDTVQTPIVGEHLLIHVSMKSVRVESWNKAVFPFDMPARTIPPARADDPHYCAVSALSHYKIVCVSCFLVVIVTNVNLYTDFEKRDWIFSLD